MSWLSRLANLVRRRDLDVEIEEELQFHIESRVRDNLADGMSEDDARRDALLRFGNRVKVREQTREANVLLHVERLWQDLRHGARGFVRQPTLTSIAIVSIAFGTGANVAIFSVADALLLRPLPVAEPSDLLAVGTRVLRGTVYQSAASYRDYQDIRDRTKAFAGVLAYDHEPVAVTTRAGQLRRIRFATFVTDNFFQVLGLSLPIGRGFRSEEAGAADPRPVAVLGDALWRSEFGEDPFVVGRTLRVAGIEVTIVGVAPASFTGLHAYIKDSLFLPLGMLPRLASLPRRDVLEARDARVLRLKGRLRPGVTAAEAQAEMTAIEKDLERAYPETNTNTTLLAQTELSFKFEQRPLDSFMIVILTTLSIAVLSVACANVAGLLASRAPARAREMALRLAIGAGRARLVRQLVTESLAIAIAGSIGGLAVSRIGIVFLRQIQFPTDTLAPPTFELDQRTFVFSLGVAILTALLVGLGPAWQTTRVDLAAALKSSDRGGSARRRLTSRLTLVALQVALALVVLTIAVFAVQVFSRELTAGPGFRTTQIAKVTVNAGQARYSDAAATRFFAGVLDETRALPGVRSAAITSAMPLFSFQFVPVLPEGQRLARGETAVPVWTNSIDDGYFTTLEIGMVAGRPFAPTDDADAPPVAIVNETLARHWWRDANPIGKSLQVLEPPYALVQIVGVVKTTEYGFPGELPQQAIYFPYQQRPRGQMVLLARTDGESAAFVAPLRDLIYRLDPDVPVYEAQTIESFYEARVTAIGNTLVRLIGWMGLMGLALTMVGLYGLVSYSVTSRVREIGIRIAVGATYARIVRMVLREGMAPAWLGLVAGIILSAATARMLARLLPISHHVGVETYYVVVPLVLVVSLIAAFLPARRAARVDPCEALRYE